MATIIASPPPPPDSSYSPCRDIVNAGVYLLRPFTLDMAATAVLQYRDTQMYPNTKDRVCSCRSCRYCMSSCRSGTACLASNHDAR